MTSSRCDRGTMSFTLLFVALLCSCATTTRPPRTCASSTTDGAPVEWRVFAHPDCGDVWIVAGGSDPKVPDVRFPVTEESVAREAFDCPSRERPEGESAAVPIALAVNFETERLELIGLGINGQISSVVQTEEEIVVQVNSTVYCGGITPEEIAKIIVVPKHAPPVRIQACTAGGGCGGPPKV